MASGSRVQVVKGSEASGQHKPTRTRESLVGRHNEVQYEEEASIPSSSNGLREPEQCTQRAREAAQRRASSLAGEVRMSRLASRTFTVRMGSCST